MLCLLRAKTTLVAITTMAAMADQPKLFIGRVMHCRLRPVSNAFVYPVFYLHLPLRNLAAASNAVFSVDRFNLLQFNAKDHGPRDGESHLAMALRQRTGSLAE